MKKKLVIVTLTLLMALFCTSAFATTSGEKLKGFGLIQGDSNGDLNEDGYLNRAELAVVLAQLTKSMDVAATYSEGMGYSDVPSYEWYAPYVNYAISQGWLNGVGDKLFDPEGTVTEEMVATVFLRVLGHNPVWGEAKYVARGLGAYVYVEDTDMISRGEVFDYMYDTLALKVSGEDITLADQIGVSLGEKQIFGWREADDAYGDSFITLDGQEIDFLEAGVATAFYYQVEEINGKYYYFIEDGSTPYKDGFTDKISYKVYNENGELEAIEVLMADGFYIALNEDEELIDEGQITLLTDYYVKEMNEDYIIYQSVDTDDPYGVLMEGGTYDEYVADYTGNILLGPDDTGESYGYAFGPNSLILRFTLGYPVEGQIYNVYDITTGEFLFDKEIWGQIDYKDDSKLIYAEGNSLKIRDIATGEELETVFVGQNVYDIEWNRNRQIGAISCYSYNHETEQTIYTQYLVNNQLEVLLETSYGLTLLDRYISYGYLIARDNYKVGLMNLAGEVVLEMEYSSIYMDEYDNEDVIVVGMDGTYYYFNAADLSPATMDSLDVTETNYEELNKILGNGYRIYDFYMENSWGQVMKDADDNELFRVDSGYILAYESLGVVCTYSFMGDSLVCDLNGNALEAFNDYVRCFSKDDKHLIAYDAEGNTYVLDAMGNVVYGPYEGTYYFYKY